MFIVNRPLRVGAVTLAVAGLLVPADAQAFFGCFQKRQDAAAALYGGTVCTPAGQQLVCNYVPQTCYRAEAVQVPVTTYRPVASCDPCTGCQTVCMKPQTCYQQQVKYTPFTTYRLQYSYQQPACAAPTTTYYAPTAAYAAPAAVAAPALPGCSSCNKGTAATTYYAPTAVVAPATTYAAPALTTPTNAYYAVPATSQPAYQYQSSGPSMNNYNYAPTYGSTPTTYAAPLAAPSAVLPGVSAPVTNSPTLNGATTYAQPSYSQPATSAPLATTAPGYSSSSTMATPTYSTPVPTYSSPATTNYGSTTITNPAPALTSPSTTSGATLGTPTLAPAPNTTSSTQPTTVISGGDLTPVPASAFAAVAPSGTSTSAYPSQPATNNPTVKSPYSSGVQPSTGMPTPTPALTMPPAPIPSATPSGTVPAVRPQPIPDPEMSRGPVIGSPTSTPHLIDPEDKTAANFPVERAWGYHEVKPHMAGYGDRPTLGHDTFGNATPAALQVAAPLPAVTQDAAAPATGKISTAELAAQLGIPLATTAQPEAQPSPADAPIPTPFVPSVDLDGWRPSGR